MNLLWDWLLQWKLWPQIILILGVLGFLYVRGWRALRARGGRHTATGWRLAAFLGGLVALALAMLSPIEVLSTLLFSAHMVQHLLIKMVGPPLIWLAAPYPILIWALPVQVRRATVGLFGRDAPFRHLVQRFLTPWVCWALYVGALWLWHLPAAYDAALNSELVHLLEHTSFFALALLFWWHLTGTEPRFHGRLSYGFRMAYALAGMAQNEVLGIIISFAGQPLYPHYVAAPRPFPISVMDDQMLGGALMWVPGGMMYGLTAIILLAAMLEQGERQAARPALASDTTSSEITTMELENGRPTNP